MRWIFISLLALTVSITPQRVSAHEGLVSVIEAEREGTCASIEPPSGDQTLEGAVVLAILSRCRLLEGAGDTAAMLAARLRAHPAADVVIEGLAWWPEVAARAALYEGRAIEASDALHALASEGEGISRGTRARYWYYAGLAAEAAGQQARAASAYEALVTGFPSSVYAARIAPRVAGRRWTPPRALELANAALAGRHYEAAEQLYLLAACGPDPCPPRDAVRSGEPARYEAAYQLGWFLYRFRREHVARALPWLETVAAARGARQADARYAYALAVERMQRFDEARRAWDGFIEQHRSDPRALGVPARLAWNHLERHRWADAASGWEQVRASSSGEERDRASWWLGWAHFRGGDLAAAKRAWQEVRGPSAQRRVRYWSGVCDALGGDEASARAAWSAMRDEDPFDYYGLLASRRLGLPLIPSAEQRASPPPARRVGRDGAQHVARLGRVDAARLLVDRERLVDDHYRMVVAADPMDWVAWSREHRAALRQVPSDVEARIAWQLAHPAFYEEVVRDQASAHEVPAALIWAIMQKESSYRTHALSRSDAMGLMQVIPQTALAIADRIDEPYVDGMLFEPYHSIRYGTWYLGALAQTFGGQWPIVMGAYNAGPVAMRSWLEAEGEVEFDIFVESMAYRQARDYVRRVISIAVRYLVAHGELEDLRSPTLGGLLPERVEPIWTGFVTF